MLTLDKPNATSAPALSDTGRRQPKLLDRMREAIRVKHYSLATERSYVGWARRFILFHSKRHPSDMGLPTFYASEGGRTVGVPRPAVRFEISAADMVINHPKKEPDADRNRRR